MKKYVTIFFLVFLFGIGIIKANVLPLQGKIIYLDPGHGGKDPGAIYKDIHEADINLKICLKLKEVLESKGAKVYMTRYGDYDLATNNATLRKRSDLYNRVVMINNSIADMYVSVHLNSDPNPKWNGAQIFYNNINKENKEIAEILQSYLNKDRKAKTIDNSYMYKRIKVKGVLIEAGFISNENDRKKLMDDKYIETLASDITDAIIEYCKVQ